MKRTYSILLTLFAFLLCSCVHEFAVIDNSFEFAAEITYDSQADERRLTLTRKNGLTSLADSLTASDPIK